MRGTAMVRTKTQRMSVVGVFHNLHDAQMAVRDLKAAGFRDDDVRADHRK